MRWNRNFTLLLTTTGISIAAFILSLESGVGCRFLQFQPSSTATSTDAFTNNSTNDSTNTGNSTNDSANNDSATSSSTTTSTTSSQLTPVNFGIWHYHEWIPMNNNNNNNDDNNNNGKQILMESSCAPYPPSIPIDATWKASRSFAILALIFGGFILCFHVFLLCLPYSKRQNSSGKEETSFQMGGMSGMWLGTLCWLTCLFQGLTFLVLDSTTACKDNAYIFHELERINSDDHGDDGGHFGEHEHYSSTQFDGCRLGSGGKFNIASTVLWFVAGVIVVVAVKIGESADDDRSVSHDDDDGVVYNNDVQHNALLDVARVSWERPEWLGGGNYHHFNEDEDIMVYPMNPTERLIQERHGDYF